jgi:hypothetical protein
MWSGWEHSLSSKVSSSSHMHSSEGVGVCACNAPRPTEDNPLKLLSRPHAPGRVLVRSASGMSVFLHCVPSTLLLTEPC